MEMAEVPVRWRTSSSRPKELMVAHVVTGAVQTHGVAQSLFHIAAMIAIAHFDKIDDHLAADVAQAQVTGDGLGRLHIGAENHSLEIRLALGFARVDVDGHQRFGLVEHQAAPRRQDHFAAGDFLQLTLEVESLPQGLTRVPMQLDHVLTAGEKRPVVSRMLSRVVSSSTHISRISSAR